MKKTFSKLLYTAIAIVFACMFSACEGPPGLDGLPGADGDDANENCVQCHSQSLVDSISVQYDLSKHGYGEAAFDESGSTGCSPCHTHEGFRYVCENNVSSAFLPNPDRDNVYVNQYSAISSSTYGEIGCFTCHSSLHTTYEIGDFFPLTSVTPVSLSFLGGAESVDLPADDHMSNLCLKCHQPRPFTQTWHKKPLLDYANLVADPDAIIYNGSYTASDTTIDNLTGNLIRPGYRTHTHYGTAGTVFAGVGGVEFGTGYGNSPHTNAASCKDCHMASMSGRAGGHTFKVRATAGALGNSTAWNFNGCNVSGCHDGTISDNITSATTDKYWKQTRTDVQTLLNTLASKLVVNTEFPVGSGTYINVEIMNRNPDAEHNLWAGLTTNNYDGYLNVFDPVNNPDGPTYNTIQFRSPSTSGWTTAQRNANNLLPRISLTKKQFGAIINFQLILRDYSLGIHNTAYTKTLLTNTLALFP